MPSAKTILIIEDNDINRSVLKKILMDEYNIIEAKDGQEGLEQLEAEYPRITAVILDLMMPVMDGFAFLSEVGKVKLYQEIPIIVSTGSNSQTDETKALSLGAWDFVSKPYNPDIIKFRLKNAINRSEMTAFQRLKYLAEYDAVTDIYNKETFFTVTRRMLNNYPEEKFVLVRFDIDRFQLVNSFYGSAEGDRLLCYLANLMKTYLKKFPISAYGRMEADVFACCVRYTSKEAVREHIEAAVRLIKEYNLSFDIIPIFGIYYIDDISLPMDTMLDRATLAAKTRKGNYIGWVAEYNPEMSRRLEQEQEILNEMQTALDEKQFCVYYQPKYSLDTNTPCGAEALVRWRHPQKGLVSPGIFIPIFEKNGFISKLDYYVWEAVCAQLEDWISKGISPNPVSVNVSRVNFYNPRIVDMICDLVERHHVPPSLFQLELTESAYTDNPQIMKQVIAKLREKGFAILMDDFGTGYSSLSILKDIEVDILKIDMCFLDTSEIAGRAENIVASIVRMAKWLNIPTIAEGAETSAQIEFLRSIGCEYVQGYYFARPMPVEEYEVLARENAAVPTEQNEKYDMDSLWASNPQIEMLFSNSAQASAIYEFENGRIEILRVNKAFYDLFGFQSIASCRQPMELVMSEYRTSVLAAFRKCIDIRGFSECEYRREVSADKSLWINLKLKFISEMGSKEIIFGSLFDITEQKKVEAELKKYKNAVAKSYTATNKLLIIDDVQINREILKTIFEGRFHILEAQNGKEAIEVLEKNDNNVDLILLDIMMPVMDGIQFLEYKKGHEDLSDIPIIMITSDNTPSQQIKTLSMGANDYIVKPFVPEIVMRRVDNVLESNSRIREILREYESAVELAQVDSLTHLYNRATAERLIGAALATNTAKMNALIMIDLDDFKQINDQYGHDSGDLVLLEFASKLRHFFRKGDIIARFGGDEFCVFLTNVPSGDFVLQKCQELCHQIRQMRIGPEKLQASCSIGIAITTGALVSFEGMYKKADSALYHSKHLGKNMASLYGNIIQAPSNAQQISKDFLWDTVDESVFIIDDETFYILYGSDAAMKLYQMSSYENKKCYEVFQNRTTPCPSCIKSQLTYDAFYTWCYDCTVLNKPMLRRDKLINYNGRPAHIQVAVDISNVESFVPTEPLPTNKEQTAERGCFR